MQHNAIVCIQWLICWDGRGIHGILPKEAPQILVPNAILGLSLAFGVTNFSYDVNAIFPV